jgi:hypothetical protein
MRFLLTIVALSMSCFAQMKTPAQMSDAQLKQHAIAVAGQLRRDFYPHAVKVHHNETEQKFAPEVDKARAKSERVRLRSACNAFTPILIEGNLLMAELNKRTGQHIAAEVLDSWIWFDCDAADRMRVEKNIKQMEFLASEL